MVFGFNKSPVAKLKNETEDGRADINSYLHQLNQAGTKIQEVTNEVAGFQHYIDNLRTVSEHLEKLFKDIAMAFEAVHEHDQSKYSMDTYHTAMSNLIPYLQTMKASISEIEDDRKANIVELKALEDKAVSDIRNLRNHLSDSKRMKKLNEHISKIEAIARIISDKTSGGRAGGRRFGSSKKANEYSAGLAKKAGGK